jgi:lipopolysaccharide export system protein LptA
MRRFGPLIVIAILFILAGVGTSYYARLKQQLKDAPAAPKKLPPGTDGAASDWVYEDTRDGKNRVSIKAKDFKQVEGKMQLTGVELHLFNKDAKKYDLVKSGSAEFDQKGNELYSPGDVEITMNVPAEKPDNEPPSGRLMSIKTSGVHFDSKTGRSTTDKPTTFGFDRGDGKCVGAEYDPNTRELHMKSAVEVVWRGSDPKTKPMKVVTDDLVYKERESKVFLSPRSGLTRDTLTLNAGPAVVTLDNKGVIHVVETVNAQGSDHQPKKNLDYAADHLLILFDDNQVQKIIGTQNARLISTADNGVTTMTADRVDMDFDTSTKDSVLTTAVSTGHSVVESKPLVKSGDPPETRILKSNVINTKMRPGGQEIEAVETGGPGSLEFVPSRPNQPHRWMNGDKIWIAYGPQNQIQTFRSVNVATRTEKPKKPDAKQTPPPALTWSKELVAHFQPNSSQIDKLEQTTDFRYEEGDRRARANRALLDQQKNAIDLTGLARVWDTTGSTDADHIFMDQKNGDFSADGNVRSTRMPDKKKDDTSGMLNQDEPLHGIAKKMVSTDNNTKIRYEGNVVLWQGANRLTADVVDIDRDDDVLKAHGHVVSQLMEKEKGSQGTGKPGSQESGVGSREKTGKSGSQGVKESGSQGVKAQAKTNGAPVFTIVRAPDLIYTDDDKLAYYKGGVLLDRGPTRVASRELKAYLRDDDNDSSLDHAFADGDVTIVNTAIDRTRTGTSQHAEYYVDDAKVVLEQGQPKLVDTKSGTSQGKQLIWYSDEDKLEVNGAVGQPAQSHLRRKKKQ